MKSIDYLVIASIIGLILFILLILTITWLGIIFGFILFTIICWGENKIDKMENEAETLRGYS
jgi:hypothetical protein